MWYLLIIVTPVIILGALYCFKENKKGTPKMIVDDTKETSQQVVKEEQDPKPERILRTSHNLSIQCIHLLGDFMVKDKNGEDISSLFTKKLRSLLAMLVLSTEDNPIGISGDEINKRLWPNKNKFDARNNRNVSLSKLRNILEKVGNVSIGNEGNYWNITFGEDVLCDYSEIMTYYQKLRKDQLKDEFHLSILLSMLYRGALLSRTDIDWINHYKGRFSYQTAEMLASLLNDPNITNPEFRVRIADTLLHHDYIHEEALRIKCLLLYELGKIEKMKSCFNEFRNNHSNLLGIPYGKTLREVLKEGGAL